MFHCNGWCFPWSISVVAGTHVCLRAVRAPAMYDAIATHKVTHLCGAPIVMATLLNAPASEKKPLPHVVEFFTAAAPPPEAVLAAMKEAGFNVTHLYGLTESYGPAVVNDWHAEWDRLDKSTQAVKKARQGVRYGALEAIDVLDPDAMRPVVRDGETLGEVMMRGNVVMKGYLKNKPLPAAGSTPAISASCTPTATSSSRTAVRTSSSPAAKTSHRSRWRTRCTSTPRSPRPRWWRNRTRNGARRRAPSSS
jgi:fatty-acyl-CoA synthase